MSLKYVSKGPSNNDTPLAQIITGGQTGNTPLSEPLEA